MERLENVAKIGRASWREGADSAAAPGLVAIDTVMLADELGTVFPNASCTVTCTAGAIDTPAVALVGCTVKASLEAAAGLMVNAADVAPVSAPDAAVKV